MWTDDSRPLVVWHSKFLAETDWVDAEFFDFARFDLSSDAPRSC